MTKTLAEVAEKMRDIDYCMLSTRAPGGAIGARPMSNNREVDYAGDSWFFTWEHALMVKDIARDPQVGLSFVGKAGLLGHRPFCIAVEGAAEVVRDKAAFAAHWTSDLDRWFDQGVETPELVMLRVRAERVHYWDGEDEGEVTL